MQPLTQNHNGIWYDPAQSGSGFQLTTLDNGNQFSFFYCGEVPGLFSAAVWFSIQGKPDTDGSYPLHLTTGAVLGQHEPLVLATAGKVTFDASADGGTITATVTVSDNGRPQFSPAPPPVTTTYTLQRLIPA